MQDEAKKEEDQYEKFECYCKKTIAELEENIQQAETNPISPADIDKKQSEKLGEEKNWAGSAGNPMVLAGGFLYIYIWGNIWPTHFRNFYYH